MSTPVSGPTSQPTSRPTAAPVRAPVVGGGRPGEALRDDIVQARAELGRTVQELMARADLRSRARASAAQAGDRMRAGLRTPTPWVALASGTATVVILALWNRRRQLANRRGRR